MASNGKAGGAGAAAGGVGPGRCATSCWSATPAAGKTTLAQRGAPRRDRRHLPGRRRAGRHHRSPIGTTRPSAAPAGGGPVSSRLHRGVVTREGCEGQHCCDTPGLRADFVGDLRVGPAGPRGRAALYRRLRRGTARTPPHPDADRRSAPAVGMPRAVVVTHLDHHRADFDDVDPVAICQRMPCPADGVPPLLPAPGRQTSMSCSRRPHRPAPRAPSPTPQSGTRTRAGRRPRAPGG